MIDIKKRLLELAEQDGCETSKYAAQYIGKLEAKLESVKEYEKQLRIKLNRARYQRDELRKQLEARHG